MKLNMTTALNKSGFVISRVQLIALDLNTNLAKTAVFVKFGANLNELNNFTAPRGRYFYT